MKHKTAVKELMSLCFDRNDANLYLDDGRKQGSTNEDSVNAAWTMQFEYGWGRRDFKIISLKIKEENK